MPQFAHDFFPVVASLVHELKRLLTATPACDAAVIRRPPSLP